MSRSPKKVLDEGYKLVEQWTASPRINVYPLVEALKQYDPGRFSQAVERGIRELTAGVAPSKYYKEKSND